MPKEHIVKRYTDDLASTLTAASLNFEIWWVYKDQDTRPIFIDTMNRYPLFFQVSIHAHFVAAVIALYRLYEQRRDSINIYRVLKLLPLEQRSALPEDFDSRLASVKLLWTKISKIRNNCFGHLNGDQPIMELFASAALTPNMMREMITASKRLINDLSYVSECNPYAFNLDARGDVIRMLDYLNMFYAQHTCGSS